MSAAPTGLRARLHLDAPAVDVDLDIPAGNTVAVLGRNGAGKSSLLNLLAGLLRPARGVVTVDGRVLVDDTTFVPAHRRSVAMLSQQARLFPHMTVRQNIAFAPQAARLGRAEVARRVERWMAAVDVVDLADRRPAQLSGGQAQRVAVARALAADPAVLLLDEPFAALDVDVAARVRTLLASVLADRSRITLLVTHDIVDAVTLADTALVLSGGAVVAHGAVREVLASPVDDFVARLAGVNLVAGRWTGGHVETGGPVVSGDAVDGVVEGAAVLASFGPRAVAVYRDVPQGSPRNVFSGVIGEIAPQGDHAMVRADCAGTTISAEITWDAVAEMRLLAGERVHLTVKAAEVSIYPSRSGESALRL